MPDNPSPASSGVQPAAHNLSPVALPPSAFEVPAPSPQAQAPQAASGAPALPDKLLQSPAGKVYAFRVLKRYQYARGYLVKKRLHAAEGNVLSKALAPFITRFSGTQGSR